MNQALIRGFSVKKIKKLTDDDEALIAEAKLPDLEPIRPEVLLDVQESVCGNRKVTLQCCAIFAVFIVFAIIGKAYVFALSLGIALLVMLIGALILHFRAQIDEEAVMMRIPVHDTKPNLLTCSAICYLPDGKYHIRYDRKLQPPKTVDVIRFGVYTYTQFRTEQDSD